MHWYRKAQFEMQTTTQEPDVTGHPEPVTLSTGEVIAAPANLLMYENAPTLDEAEIVGTFAGAEDALQLASQYNPELFKHILKIIKEGGPYGKYVPAETEAISKEIGKAMPGFQLQAGPIIHINIDRIVSEAMAHDPVNWYNEAVIQTAATMIHEATHASGGDEGQSQAAERDFMNKMQEQISTMRSREPQYGDIRQGEF